MTMAPHLAIHLVNALALVDAIVTSAGGDETAKLQR